jgi:hypothetical protein
MYFKFKEHVVSRQVHNPIYTNCILDKKLYVYSVGSTVFSKFKFKSCVTLVVDLNRVTSVT